MTYLTLAQIDGRIGRLSGRYLKVNEDVQEIAVSIINHANEHGDCSRASTLCRAVPARLRNLLIFWFRNVSPINVTIAKSAKDDKARLRKATNADGSPNPLYNKFDLDKAKANNWFDNPFELPEDNVLMTVGTFKERIERLFTSMDNATKEDSDKVANEDKGDIRAFRDHMRNAYVAYFKDVPVTTYDGLEEDETVSDEPDTVEAMAAAAAA